MGFIHVRSGSKAARNWLQGRLYAPRGERRHLVSDTRNGHFSKLYKSAGVPGPTHGSYNLAKISRL